jgi:predicted DNA-binding transcriptional regulator YafY
LLSLFRPFTIIPMAKRKPKSVPATGAVTAERAARLVRLLKFLGNGPQTRTNIMKKLRLGVRGFYRDLESLRQVAIEVQFTHGRYRLAEHMALALERLLFPDPGLTLGEARQLARGRSKAHKKIRDLLSKIER